MSRPVSPPVFLVDTLPGGTEAVLAGAEAHHAGTVRRLRPGEAVRLSDGFGGLADCTVTWVGADRLTLVVLGRTRVDPPQPRFVVVQALAKGDRAELAVELLTEVGADEVVPWPAARSVVVWRDERGAKALARWRATAREAAKQSRRAWLPVISEPQPTAVVAERIAAAGGGLVLDRDATVPLRAAPVPTGGDLIVVVGPEGGIIAEELAAFAAAGARPVRLGPTVLRTSTAGAAALAALSVQTGRWG
jgi:16S rRNA (uracil1498-N3)-methyltransferase